MSEEMGSENNGFEWYVVRCFSGHERKVKEYLTREIEERGLEYKIKEILIPTETVVEIRSGKKRTREKRSEEHTSELQSRGHLVCRLLHEIKKYDMRCVINMH